MADNLYNFKIRRIPPTTLKDMCHSLCNDIRESMDQERDSILLKHNFNIDTAMPNDIEHYTDLCQAEPKTISRDLLAKEVQSFNSKMSSLNDKDCLIKTLRFIHTMESNKESSVYIAIDEVGVKKQSYERDRSAVKKRRSKLKGQQRAKQRKLNKKKNAVRLKEKFDFEQKSLSSWGDDKTNIHTTLVHIHWNNTSFMIKGESIDEALKQLVAFLLENNLLTSKRLVFFTDGARNLKKAIDEKFFYTSYHVILDWYHVSHYIMQVLSTSLNGSIEDKRADKSKVAKHIWFANVTKAIQVIEEFNKNGRVRNLGRLNSLIDYIKRRAESLSGYALRKELGYCNSSSQAEKSNDLAVARRQKHNGMSWSTIGSNDLSSLTVAKENNKLDEFIRQRQLQKMLCKVDWFKAQPSNDETPINAPEESNAA